jgi:Arc/MetJ-type ribon-helix-helix transcriptional regulator
MPSEDKVAITVRIPASLYDVLVKAVSKGEYTSQTACVIIALEQALKADMQVLNPDLQADASNKQNESNIAIQLIAQQLQDKEIRVLDLQAHNDTMKKEIDSLNDQLKAKDRQFEAQAIHLQTVLNQKAIEAPGAKKRWFEFWK